MAMLRAGDTITIETGSGRTTTGTVGVELGCGGQGCVFELSVHDGSLPDTVVKWYNDYYANHFRAEQLQAIRDLLEVGPPSPRYMWPRTMAFAEGNNSFGYVMDRRPGDFEKFSVVAGTNKLSPDAEITFAIQVGHALQELHTRGFAYRDVNLSNFFIRLPSGESLICDTDNIGSAERPYMGVRGKAEFMAPEIVRGEGKPNANTDRHSLAVLLFMMFVRGHPLEGRATLGLHDDEAQLRYYGQSPVFCFDPDDASNRPDHSAAHLELYWSWYPQRIRDLFTRAFTVGLHDAQHGRVLESEWLEALVALRDSTLPCPACGGLNFFDVAAPRHCRRPGCGAAHDEPSFLDVKLGNGRTRRLVVRPDRRLFGYHVRGGYAHLDEVGQIVHHPNQPGDLGLLNTGQHAWEVRYASGGTHTIGPRSGAPLQPGVVIRAEQATITWRSPTSAP